MGPSAEPTEEQLVVGETGVFAGRRGDRADELDVGGIRGDVVAAEGRDQVGVAVVKTADVGRPRRNDGVEQAGQQRIGDIDGRDAGEGLGRGDDQRGTEGIQRAGGDIAETGARDGGDVDGGGGIGDVDDVEAEGGGTGVEVVALPGDAPDAAGDVTVVDVRKLKLADECRCRGVGDIPDVDPLSRNGGHVGGAVGLPGVGDLVGLRLAGAEVAQHLGALHRGIGIGDVPDLVDRVPGEDDVAIIDRGLVEVQGTQLRADGGELLGRRVGEVRNHAVHRKDRRHGKRGSEAEAETMAWVCNHRIGLDFRTGTRIRGRGFRGYAR